MPQPPEKFKFALAQEKLETFNDDLQSQYGQPLEAIAAQNPFTAYALIIERALMLGDVNGVAFSHEKLRNGAFNRDQLPDGQSFPEDTIVARELKRRIPDPSWQRVDVEVHSWRTSTTRPFNPRQLAPYKVFGFHVGPLELPD
jgi:hypothetical protein